MATIGGFQVGAFQPLPAYQQVEAVVVEEDTFAGFPALWKKKRKRQAELENLRKEICRVQDECDIRDIVKIFMMIRNGS